MPRCATKACICALLTLWIFTACCCFIATCVIYLKPFLKVVRYKETKCHVETSFYATQYVCPCASGPTGSKHHCPSYPCLLVHVSLNTTSLSGRQHLAVVPLYIDDLQQATVNDASADELEMCTLLVCSGDTLWNRDRIDNFSRQLTVMSDGYRLPVTCLYDPWDPRSGAVLAATVHGWPVFHAIFWPFFCAVVGLLVCVGFCHRCHRVAVTTPTAADVTRNDDVTSYAVAARALLHAQKRRKHRSIRNLWMMQQNA